MMARRLLAIALALAAGLLLAACPQPDSCEARYGIQHVGVTNATHVGTDCSVTPACGNGVNPPTGGPHCSFTVACRQYDAAQPRCSWIHNLEHGHAVLAYNCPEGCPEVVAALGQLWNESPIGSGAHRALVTPDPLLPRRVAAVVWGWSYVADEVNPDAIRCLLAHQDEEAPERGLPCSP